MKSNETICIAWVHGGVVDTEFAISMMTIVKSRKQVVDYHCVYGTGLLAKSRNIVVSHFLNNTKADWLLMLDADERISVEAFDKLVKTADSKEKRFVAGLYFGALWEGANLRPVPLIFNTDETGGINPWDNYPQDSVVEISAAGTGCMLIHRSVFLEIQAAANPLQGPDWCWFQDGPIGENRWLSEDLSFCARVSQAGIKMYANTGATLGHHKDIWVTEEMFQRWLAVNQAGTGLSQLQ